MFRERSLSCFQVLGYGDGLTVGTLVGTGCRVGIGWSMTVSGCCVIRVCWSVSGIVVGEVHGCRLGGRSLSRG